MGIFDIFKTKVSETSDKVGDVAGDVGDKVGDTLARDEEPPATGQAGGGAVQQAERMVSEGGPVADTGEAAPGMGDDGAAEGADGAMTGTIKQNLSSGVDKAADMADSKTGGKYTDQIQSAADKAKDRLG
jgi:hypothetical protein